MLPDQGSLDNPGTSVAESRKVEKYVVKINLLQTSAIGYKYLNSLKLNGCCQGTKKHTRVTPASKSLLDHIVHNDCLVSSKPILQTIIQLMSNWI